ncbi:glycosyl transferase [Colletotrichum plurivorum]|uniref:Glycosyl transferase n=2 Tax=Colletotrichum orchidearum species complex TaxID=2707337 RepID=A0A8H6KTL7_9PEZI|nr:glycosyl transferase [Colletotrichum sojae]KAF6836711.1 glycosyl transferase [Colletotrichum plurivorum]
MASVFRPILFAILAALHIGSVLADGDINLCGQSDHWNSTTVPYSFNNNAWGNDSSGYQCMAVHDGGKSFSVKYKWDGDASLVKGFPYLKAHPARLPVQLWNVSRLQFTADWKTYVAGKENASPDEAAKLFDDIGLHANVAIDMFLSDDIANSTGLNAPLEIMIWPWWVPTVKPLGWAESTPDKDTVVVDGTPFSLYHGWNDGGQHVFSWLARKNLTSADADFSPLLKYIWQKGMLSGALYLGQLELGTEIKHAGAEVHFEVSNYNLSIVRQGDPEDRTSTSSSAAPTSTSSKSSTSSLTPTTTLPSELLLSATTATPTSSNAAVAPTQALMGAVPWSLALAALIYNQ